MDMMQGTSGFLTAEQVAGYGPAIESHADLADRMSLHFDQAIGAGRIKLESGQHRDSAAADAGEVFLTHVGEQMLSAITREPKTTHLMTPGPGQLLPIRETLDKSMKTLAWNIETPTGSAGWVDPQGLQRLPQVGEYVERETRESDWSGIGYGWSLTELWQASAPGATPIQMSRPRNAASTLQRMNERVGLHGDVTRKIPGILSLSSGYQALMGTGFQNETDPDAALLRLQLIQYYFERLAKSYMGTMTTVIAPVVDQLALTRLRYGANGEGPNMFAEAKMSMKWLDSIRWIDGLETAAATGGALWCAWSDDSDEFWNELTPTPMVFGPFTDGGGLRTAFVLITHIGGPVLRRRERFMRYEFAA